MSLPDVAPKTRRRRHVNPEAKERRIQCAFATAWLAVEAWDEVLDGTDQAIRWLARRPTLSHVLELLGMENFPENRTAVERLFAQHDLTCPGTPERRKGR